MTEAKLMNEFISEKEGDVFDRLDYSVLNKSKDEDNSDLIFKGLQESKLGTIQGVIDDINELIGQREDMSKLLLKDFDKMKLEVGTVLMQSQDHMKLNPELIKERLELRKKIVDLEEARINEKVNSWRDVAMLKKELRESVKEFKESENSIDILDQIIGE
jgi:glutamine synthetase type III